MNNAHSKREAKNSSRGPQGLRVSSTMPERVSDGFLGDVLVVVIRVHWYWRLGIRYLKNRRKTRIATIPSTEYRKFLERAQLSDKICVDANIAPLVPRPLNPSIAPGRPAPSSQVQCFPLCPPAGPDILPIPDS